MSERRTAVEDWSIFKDPSRPVKQRWVGHLLGISMFRKTRKEVVREIIEGEWMFRDDPSSI